MSIYCPTNLPDFAIDPCDSEPSRIIAVAFMRLDHSITDFESASQWQAAIDAGQAVVIKPVAGEETPLSPNTIAGYGKEETRTVGISHTVNYEHNFADTQTDFYNALNFSKDRYFAFYTAGGKLFVNNDATVNVVAKRIVPKVLNDIIKWDVEVKWSSQAMALENDGPATIFE